MWARINLIPLLQAEEDRDQVRRYWADQKREKELLGENTKVYNNERYVARRMGIVARIVLTADIQSICATDICRLSGGLEIDAEYWED
jgi:hypothetical protein